MKTLIAIISAVALNLTVINAGDAFAAKEFAVEVFSTYSTAQSAIGDASINSITRDGDWGVGIGTSYFLTEHIGVGAETWSAADTICDEPFQNIGLSLQVRAPIQRIAVAPYAIGGSSVAIRDDERVTWFAGGGIEWRPLCTRVGVFAEARYLWPHATSGDEGAMFRLGTRFAF